MKVLIIYCSEYRKHTEKIAQFFANTIDCDIVNIKKSENPNIENYDIVGFGSGVYR